MEDNNTTNDTMNLGSASAVANGTSMQVDAHSNGLKFEQSIGQQQNHFQTGLTASTTNIKHILNFKAKRANILERSNIRYIKLANKLNNK